MIYELADLIDDFPGPQNQTWCFLHILDLVVKSIIWQFDLAKSQKTSGDEGDGNDNDNKATKELLKLAGEIDLEEEITVCTRDEVDGEEDDEDKGWIDEHIFLTKDELKELGVSVWPIRQLLTKVR